MTGSSRRLNEPYLDHTRECECPYCGLFDTHGMSDIRFHDAKLPFRDREWFTIEWRCNCFTQFFIERYTKTYKNEKSS